MVTYWLNVAAFKHRCRSLKDFDQVVDPHPKPLEAPSLVKSEQKLVDWIVRVLTNQLKEVVACRDGAQNDKCSGDDVHMMYTNETNPIDELSDEIPLPSIPSHDKGDPSSIILDDKVETQLREYVAAIAVMYKANPFHNFQHASHVIVSTLALLRQSKLHYENTMPQNALATDDTNDLKHNLIRCDPMLEFGVVFSALIHDVAHLGMSNQLLIQDTLPIAQQYKNRSVAQQNSIDIAWRLLMQPEYVDLRKCIFPTVKDHQRFRQIVVNAVLATDINDNYLTSRRLHNFMYVFNQEKSLPSSLSRKAAILIEYSLQASDVIHTMQHWNIYEKWNQRLLEEIFLAFQSGHETTNPTEVWYDQELSFFDNYIIPLANRMKLCDLFGESYCAELLNFATRNRNQWAEHGRRIVQQFQDKMENP
jgi:3'5'-cyclic nucleotide phosphodiesterase